MLYQLMLIIFLFLGFVSTNTVKAQQLEKPLTEVLLKGKVVIDNNVPLAYASLFVLDKDSIVVKKTVTDVNGAFELRLSGKVDYVLLVRYTGYLVYKMKVSPLQDRNLGLIKLLPDAKMLNEVTVRSNQKVVETDGSNIIFNVSKSITAQGTTALEALKKAPGVFVDNNDVVSLNGKPGVMILLDGKQTYMGAKELADLLKSMPSSGIKSIEIINSPTAKYDASGSAGIINIRTQKMQAEGLNGTITTGIAYGVFVKQNQDLSFNYRDKGLNIYGSYNHFFGNYAYLYGSNRIQDGKRYNSNTDDTDKRKKMGARLGADYAIDQRNTVGILVNGNFLFGGGITDTKTLIGLPASENIEESLDAINDYYFQRTNRYNLNLNYKYEDTLGHIFNVDADYSDFKKGNGNLQSNSYKDRNQAVLSQNLYHTLNDIDISLNALKLDYTTNIFKGKLETGAKYSGITANNSAQFYHVLEERDSLDDRRSNTFKFEEQVYSGYVNYKKILGKWSLQAGLRLEHSASNGELNYRFSGVENREYIEKKATDLFPSFSIAVKPQQNHNFSLGYSRRIDRPAYQDLNPFVYMLDELSFWQGNPFLQPQLSHRATLQYVYKNLTIVGITYAHTDNYSARIIDTIETIKIVMVPRNLGIQKSISLFITQSVTLANWWELTFNGTLFQIRNIIAFDKDRKYGLKQLAARINLQQTFKLPFKLTGEVTGYLNTKKLVGANEFSRGTNQVDLGLQRKLLREKATLRLALTDIYKGSKSYGIQQVDGLTLTNYGYYEGRQIRLNFTYNLLNSNTKSPRSRGSALDLENGRIK
ncbi:MAG: outer membrane beta-barrel family protein [Candidatus Pedobacter colombiensis]|uniref:Outer membrane beta-barrel family protein n=1 Tax=Candidatus Pedobacter colombiensis TaxID=3121371 RepID=A0AAJ5W540_9SPHI|nr:outer membrane beta-barrel family protein [Pedobacter sp.]WEK17426.1 MAG: outer membrane beta-barrel family protein [Pedobacter sp.]